MEWFRWNGPAGDCGLVSILPLFLALPAAAEALRNAKLPGFLPPAIVGYGTVATVNRGTPLVSSRHFSRYFSRHFRRHFSDRRLGWQAIGWGLGVVAVSVTLMSSSAAIGIAQPAPSEGATRPTAGALNRPLLKPGSQGAEVLELQATLKLLGFYAGAVDGVYGLTTVTAVSRFQQAAGLTADGIVGPDTWNHLFPAVPDSTTAAPAAPASPTAPSSPKAAASGKAIDLPTLKLGAKGGAVVTLQERLQAIGVLTSSADGIFGTETQAAVKAAQQKFGLEPDGVVGPATWKALGR